MQFSKFIPVSVKEQELSRKLISVFDGLQAYKEEIIYGSLRTTNFALIDDKKWLLKKLADYGFSGLPYEMPLLVLQQQYADDSRKNAVFRYGLRHCRVRRCSIDV